MGNASPPSDATNTVQQPVAQLIRTRSIALSRQELTINFSKIALVHFIETPHNNTITTSPGGDYLIIGDDRGQVEVCATYLEWVISVLKR